MAGGGEGGGVNLLARSEIIQRRYRFWQVLAGAADPVYIQIPTLHNSELRMFAIRLLHLAGRKVPKANFISQENCSFFFLFLACPPTLFFFYVMLLIFFLGGGGCLIF